MSEANGFFTPQHYPSLMSGRIAGRGSPFFPSPPGHGPGGLFRARTGRHPAPKDNDGTYGLTTAWWDGQVAKEVGGG